MSPEKAMDFNDFKRQKVVARNDKHDIAWYQAMFRLGALDGPSKYQGPVDGDVNADLAAAIADLQLANGLSGDRTTPDSPAIPPAGGWEPLGVCPGYGSASFAKLLDLAGARGRGLWVIPGCSRPFFITSLGEADGERFDRFTWIDSDGTIIEADSNLEQLRQRHPHDAEVLLAQYGPSQVPADRQGSGMRQLGSGLPSISNPIPGQRTRNDRRGQGYFRANRNSTALGDYEHKGLDILGEPGTSVLSPITGTVTAIGYSYPKDTRSRSVHITGNGQYAGIVVKVLYLTEPVSVHPRENVTRGSTILGILWDIGLKIRGARPHVHLEVTHNGVLVDPAQLIDEWRER
jgi:hypothetical protein